MTNGEYYDTIYSITSSALIISMGEGNANKDKL
jgi:hypothetical protein